MKRYIGRSGLIEGTLEKNNISYEFMFSKGGGHRLMHGDSFYYAPTYHKYALNWTIASLEDSSLIFNYSLHQTPEHIAHSQKMTIQTDF